MKIIDIIDHRNKYGIQRFIVTSRKPEFLYERKNGWLIAEDSGFFSFYKHDWPSGRFYAFAGRKFDIPMMDGSVEKAYGQWWYGVPDDYCGLLAHIGCGTPDSLGKCNVFCSGEIDPVLIEEWIAENNPSNNYHKYDKRHADYGKHTIISRWE